MQVESELMRSVTVGRIVMGSRERTEESDMILCEWFLVLFILNSWKEENR